MLNMMLIKPNVALAKEAVPMPKAKAETVSGKTPYSPKKKKPWKKFFE